MDLFLNSHHALFGPRSRCQSVFSTHKWPNCIFHTKCSLGHRATKCDVIRPPAKPNNHASGSKQLVYTAVDYELLAVNETIQLQGSDVHPKFQYTLTRLGGILFNMLNIKSGNFG